MPAAPPLPAPAVLLALPVVASADTAPTSASRSAFEHAHLGVEGSLCLWNPIGELSLVAGIGGAFSGPQVSGMARLHLLMLRILGGLGHIVSDDDACVASGSSGGDSPTEYGPRCDDPDRTLPFGGLALRTAFAIGG